MDRMTEDEAWEFLRRGSRTATFASIRADGSPNAVPTWYAVEDGCLVFTTWHTTVKAANIRRDARVAMAVQDDQPPYDYVAVEGTAELIDDLAECRRISTLLGAKYMGQERAEEFGRRNGVEGELVVRVTPRRVHGFFRIAG